MCRTIAFANRKGGSGKTATTVNVAAFLAHKGYTTLMVDLDPQAHASISVGVSPYRLKSCMRDLLLEDEVGPMDIMCETVFPKLHLLPASHHLECIDGILEKKDSPETVLAEKLEPLLDQYDFILFDCPATPGFLLKNAMVAAQELLIPMQTQFLAMEGLAQMTRMVYEINATFNSALRIIGVVPTLSNLRTRLAKSILSEVRKNFGYGFLYPTIRLDIRLAESPSYGQPILHYAPRSHGSEDYERLTECVLKTSH